MSVQDKAMKGLDLKTVLKLADAPHPDEHWEGMWTFCDVDPDNEYALKATARLRFASGLVEGRGVMIDDDGDHALDIDISGAATGSELSFTTFVGNSDGVNGNLSCVASLSGDRSVMTGSFKHACFNTAYCEPDCQGGWGDFEMQRIVDRS